MSTPPETPRKQTRVPSSGLPTPPPTFHRDRDASSRSSPILAPPLFCLADEPEPNDFPPRQTIIPGPGSPSPLPRRLPAENTGNVNDVNVKREERGAESTTLTMAEEGDDDEIQCLGFGPAAQSNQVARRPQAQHPQQREPLFLPIDAEYDLFDDIPPRRPAPPEAMDMDDFEFVGMGPGTPLNEVNESEQGDGEVCRACGCDCQSRGQRLEEESRRRGGGSGSRVLSNRILGNILGLLLGQDSLLKQLQSSNRRFQRWEDVSAEVGARRADFDRVRKGSNWMQLNLPFMKRQGRF